MRHIKFASALLLAGALVSAQTKPAPPIYKDIKYPPLHNVKVPEPARFQLSNGMTVFLLEDHELPTISMQALVRTGARYVPEDKAGLAQIAGRVMRTGGTLTHKGDDLDKQLDFMGAVMETNIGNDSGMAMISALKEDFDKILPLLMDVLQHPAFPEDKIELEKTAHRDAISRRNEDHMAIAGREFSRMIYGKDSPYSRRTEYDTINSITRDDLIAFHKQFFQPENVILGVWGDFKAADMKAKIEQTFGAWAKGGNPKPTVPEVDTSARNRTGVYVVNKDDINQSVVYMGALGGKRNDPDYVPNVLLSTILGGGEFGSRMLDNIRSKAGLAYATGSSWSAQYDHPGVYVGYVGTKSNTTAKALELMKQEIARIGEGEVTDKEFKFAKEYILKGQAFDFDSTEKVVGRLMTYEYYGYPLNYLQKFTDAVNKATKADLQRVAKQYWDSNKMAVLLVGKTADFDKPVSSFGEVHMIDISIPKPKGEQVGAATPESLDAGKQLLAKVREAHGGGKLAGIKDYKSKADMTVTTPQGEMSLKTEETVSVAGKSVQKITTPMGEMIQGFDGQTAWMKSPQGVREAPPQMANAAKESAFRETIPLLEAKDLKAQALGTVKLNGKDYQGLLVSDPTGKMQVKLFVDPSTGLLAGKGYSGMGMMGPGEMEEIYLDYKDVDGVKFPSHVILNQNGKKTVEVKASDIQVNTGAPDNAFTKP